MKTPVAIAAWHQEHVYFNQLLHLLRREVDVFHLGSRPNYELMYDIVSYLSEYGDAVHHPREDVAFDRLVKRCPDIELELARLGQEHRIIKQAGEKLLALIEAVLEDAMVPRAELEIAAATYLVYYGNHIAKEEEDVLSRAALHLTPEDWEAVKRAAPGVQDPLFSEHAKQRYSALRRRIVLEA
jgi:hemerythrin-like domain-containing protein